MEPYVDDYPSTQVQGVDVDSHLRGEDTPPFGDGPTPSNEELQRMLRPSATQFQEHGLHLPQELLRWDTQVGH